MNDRLELLRQAKRAASGIGYDYDQQAATSSAVDYIIQYLLAQEAPKEYQRLCDLIDECQRTGDVAKAAALMVERDKVQELL